MNTRKEDILLEFGIYRKPIWAHRLFSVSMEKQESEANRNGYTKKFVNKIRQNHERKKHRQNAFIFQPEKEGIQKVSLPFYPKITNAIRNTLNQHGF